MYCPDCKTENAHDAERCQDCGSILKPSESKQGALKKRLSRRVFILVAAALFLALIVGGGAFMCAKTPSSKQPLPADSPTQNPAESPAENPIQTPAQKVERSTDYEWYENTPYYLSKDQKTLFLVLDGEVVVLDKNAGFVIENGYDSILFAHGNGIAGVEVAVDHNNTAYLVTSKEVRKIADDVDTSYLAPMSNKGAYFSRDGALWVFDTSSAEVKQAVTAQALEALGSCTGHPLFSPSGDTLIYPASNGLLVYRNNTVTTFDMEVYPLSVSDNGEYIYCYQQMGENYTLYCLNGATMESTKITDFSFSTGHSRSSFWLEQSFFINTLGTELIYWSEEGMYYVEKNNKPVKLSDDPDIPMLAGQIMPENALGSTSLKERFYLGDSEIFYLDENLELVSVACAENPNAVMSADGATVSWLDRDKGDFYYLQLGTNKKVTASVMGVDGVFGHHYTAVNASNDGRFVYYADDYSDLRRIVDGSKIELVAENVLDIRLTSDNKLYFFDNDFGERAEENPSLFYHDGSKDIRINDKVYEMWTHEDKVYYTKITDIRTDENGDMLDRIGDLYLISNARESTKILSDIII
jgi:hypothetical protein